jgi:hypothetical protein
LPWHIDNNTASSAIYYCLIYTGGASDTFSISCGSSCYPTISAAAFSLAPTYDAGKENGGGMANSNTVNTGSITPSGNGELIIAGASWDEFSGTAPTITGVNGSYKIAASSTDSAGGGYSGAIAYWVQPTAASTSATFTASTNGYQTSVIAAFVVSGSAPYVARRRLF